MNELVSIFSPVYNISSRYPGALERFLDSIKNQTYTNIEVILVDDGSTDDSAAICDRWVQMDSRFHVVRHGTNLTINKARETGFRHCSGSLVFNADPDDLLHPQAIEVQYALIKGHPDCQMVVGTLYPHWEETVDFIPITNPSYEILGQSESVRRLFRSGNHTVWNKLYRRELLESIDWDVTSWNDFHLTLQIWLNCNKFVHLKDTTYFYIHRELSETYTKTVELKTKKYDTLIMDWNRYIHGKHPEYYADFLYRAYIKAITGFSELSDENKDAWRKKLREFYKLTWNDYISCDAPLHEKAVFWWLKYFPQHKFVIKKLKSLMS